jgi:hypothetical protein
MLSLVTQWQPIPFWTSIFRKRKACTLMRIGNGYISKHMKALGLAKVRLGSVSLFSKVMLDFFLGLGLTVLRQISQFIIKI